MIQRCIAVLFLIALLQPDRAQAQDPLAPFLVPGASLSGATALVGKTPGNFEVGGAGNATYSIPLVVPPGTAGSAPSLSLVYDSRTASGIAGKGWALSGLSAISRCASHIVPQGVLDPVDFDANDQFCLDGQLLIPTNNGYRTEIDTFAKIVPSGGTATNPDRWTVWTKDGKILEFGGTTDSRIEALGSAVLIWALNKSQDRAGNYFTVTYGEVNSLGFFAPLRIDYTGNSAASLSPSNAIVFHYENRPDVSPVYEGGAKRSTPVRLKQVETFAGSTIVRAYSLSYETGSATGFSRLIAVQECGFNGTTAACLPATSLEWQEAQPLFTQLNNWLGTSGPGGATYSSAGHEFVGDFDGNGRTDLLYYNGGWNVALSNGSGLDPAARWFSGNGPTGLPYNQGQEFVADFDGDGLSDLIYYNNGWYLMRSTGSGFEYPTLWLGTSGPGGGTYSTTGHRFIGDFDGDSRADYMYYNGGWNVALSHGTSPTTASQWLGSSGPSGVTYNSGQEFAADFNGDGMADYMYYNGGWYVSVSTGAGFTTPALWLGTSGPGGNTYNSNGHHYIADFNHDGLADYMYYNNGWNVALSTGTGFAPATQWLGTTGPGGGTFNANLHERTGDFNGDGFADLIYYNSGWNVALSNGKDHLLDAVQWLGTSGPGGGTFNANGHEYFTDLSGDGRTDFLYYNSGWNVAHKIDPYPDLLTAITDGFGEPIYVEYLPMTTGQVYESGSGDTYPIVEVHGRPDYLVFASYLPQGLGGSKTVHMFYYRSERYDARRWSNLGFEWIRDTDQARGITTMTYFNQEFPIQGTQSASEVYDSSLRVRKTRTLTPLTTAANTIGNPYPIYRYFVAQRDDEFFEADGETLTVGQTVTQQVDAYNNPTTETSTSSDGYGKATTITYTNDVANWLIGLPTQVQIVASAPGVPNITRTATYTNNATTGLRTQEVLQPGTSLQLTQAFSRDGFGNVTSVTTSGANIATRTESATFDAKGTYPISATNALNQTQMLTFDARFGVPLSATSINALTTSFVYDPLGNELTRTNTDGSVTSTIRVFCPDAAVPCPSTGVVSIGTLRSGVPPQYEAIDVLGRDVRQSTLGFAGTLVHTDIEYNSVGRVDRRSLPYFDGASPLWTSFTYDTLDRPLTETRPDGNVTAFAYEGLAVAITNPLLQTKAEVRNSQDRVIRTTDAANNSNTFTYDAFGNMLSATDPLNHVTTMTYDALGRRLTMNDPDLGLRTRAYDVLGQLTSTTDAKSQTRTFQLDKLGRITQFTEADGSTTFTYDTATKGVGALASVSGTTGGQSFTKTFTYDSVGRPSSTTLLADARSYVMTAQYDSMGRPSGLVYPGGFATRSLYNSVGYLSRVENAANSSAFWIGEAANAAGQITQELLGNNLRTQQTIDPNTLQVTQIRSGTGTGSGVQNLSYAWNPLGNLTQRSDANRSLAENFQYDSLGRLSQSQVVGSSALTYTYNAIGNLLSKSDVGTYSYGATVRPHAVTSTSGPVTRTYTYDANGNQTQQVNGSTTVASFAYTSFDKPSSITVSNALGVNASTFRYDERGDLLVRKDIPPAGETETIYHLGGVFEEVVRSGGSTEKTHYIQVGGRSVAVYTLPSSGSATVRYLHRDHLGSVETITASTGALVESLSYDAFGKRRNSNWTPAATPIVSGLRKGFTDHEALDKLGLVHMGGRVYDPTLGRFTSADPFVISLGSQGFNRYSYVENNPLSRIDPTGYFVAGPTELGIGTVCPQCIPVLIAASAIYQVAKLILDSGSHSHVRIRPSRAGFEPKSIPAPSTIAADNTQGCIVILSPTCANNVDPIGTIRNLDDGESIERARTILKTVNPDEIFQRIIELGSKAAYERIFRKELHEEAEKQAKAAKERAEEKFQEIIADNGYKKPSAFEQLGINLLLSNPEITESLLNGVFGVFERPFDSCSPTCGAQLVKEENAYIEYYDAARTLGLDLADDPRNRFKTPILDQARGASEIPSAVEELRPGFGR